MALLGAAALCVTTALAQEASTTIKTTAGTQQTVVLDLGASTVMDSANQKVGKVDHLVINPSGCIDLAVLNMERDRLVAVPWQLVTVEKSSRLIGGQQSVFHVNVDRAKLQQAPAVQKEQLVNISQQQTQIYQYFGVQPSTATGATGAGTTTTQGTEAGKPSTTQTNLQTQPGSQRPDYQRPTQPGRPENRPPANRPPDNRPPENRPPDSTPPPSPSAP
jgi:hypothetical protein